MAGCGSHSSSWGRVLRVPLSGGNGAEEQKLERSEGLPQPEGPWPREGRGRAGCPAGSLLQLLLLAWSSPGGTPGCRPEQAGTLPWSPGLPGGLYTGGA